ncbi:hypothetical protein HAX54_007231 [Datura stramonium]|uniref:Protein kinase domain-containing protein n=1 Tax=Datura stramonium TaxID=4076 RepID=A0ABS8RV45_DATST|nr:hypothetical protein [Datura stramonium]
MKKPIFLLILLFVVQYYSISISVASSNETDQEALLAFRNLVTSRIHFLANNWTKNTSFCSWFGVTCSSRRQRVVALALPDLQLQGTISPSLANLSFLSVLNLGNNNFHGGIPYGIGHLPRLRVIDVQNNQLQGSIPTSLLEIGFDNMTNLLENLVADCILNKKSQPCTADKKKKGKSKDVEKVPEIRTYQLISYHEIQRATNNFDGSNLIGMGSSGSMYRGTLSSGTVVAIKVLDLENEQVCKRFDTECEVMRNVRHRNLVPVITTCSSDCIRAFVLKYMSNGNLENWLYKEDCHLNLHHVRQDNLAYRIYSDKLVLSHFDIRAQCNLSQVYSHKDLLVAILNDAIENTENLPEKSATLYDLETLSTAYFLSVEDVESILRKMPNLRTLRCELSGVDNFQHHALDFPTRLEKLKICLVRNFIAIIPFCISAPNLKNLTVDYVHLVPCQLSNIAQLQNLQVLKLEFVWFGNNKWEVSNGEFPQLKVLKLQNLFLLEEWTVADDAFSYLEHLVFRECEFLKEIPSCFGNSCSLKYIEARARNKFLVKSARDIRDTQVEDYQNSDFDIFIY